MNPADNVFSQRNGGVALEKNNLLPEKDTKIQLVVNNPDT